MNEARRLSASAVFEGRIVVSGGVSSRNKLNTVESYDLFGKKWLFMPNMIRRRILHKMVVVRNMLFVIGEGTNSCEVFYKTSMKFVGFKSPYMSYLPQVVPIEKQIYIFGSNSLTYCYDVKKNEWSTESCEANKNLSGFSCVKLQSF